MPKILITSRGKSKYVEVSDKAFDTLAIHTIFEKPDSPIVLGKYTFMAKEINCWPPPEPLENTQLL